MLAPSSPRRLAKSAEEARPVRRGDAEADDAVVALEFAHHDGGEEAGVDVAAAEHEADAPARETLRLGEEGREPRRTGALGHGALEGGVGGDRALDGRLLDEDDLCDEVAHDRQGLCADGLDRDALGQGRRRRSAVPRRERAFQKEG